MSQYNINNKLDINLHSRIEDNSMIYLSIVNKIMGAIKFVSDKDMMPLAFGLIFRNQPAVSDLFALNSYQNYSLLIDEFESRYSKLIEKAKLSSPANHSQILKTLNIISQWNANSKMSTYFFHLHITPGHIDDFDALK